MTLSILWFLGFRLMLSCSFLSHQQHLFIEGSQLPASLPLQGFTGFFAKGFFPRVTLVSRQEVQFLYFTSGALNCENFKP